MEDRAGGSERVDHALAINGQRVQILDGAKDVDGKSVRGEGVVRRIDVGTGDTCPEDLTKDEASIILGNLGMPLAKGRGKAKVDATAVRQVWDTTIIIEPRALVAIDAGTSRSGGGRTAKKEAWILTRYLTLAEHGERKKCAAKVCRCAGKIRLHNVPFHGKYFHYECMVCSICRARTDPNEITHNDTTELLCDTCYSGGARTRAAMAVWEGSSGRSKATTTTKKRKRQSFKRVGVPAANKRTKLSSSHGSDWGYTQKHANQAAHKQNTLRREQKQLLKRVKLAERLRGKNAEGVVEFPGVEDMFSTAVDALQHIVADTLRPTRKNRGENE
jgi:hypothetical protein